MSSGMVKELKGEVEAVFINNEKSSAAIGLRVKGSLHPLWLNDLGSVAHLRHLNPTGNQCSICSIHKIRTFGPSSGLFSGSDKSELSFWSLEMTQGGMHAPAAEMSSMRVAVSHLIENARPTPRLPNHCCLACTTKCEAWQNHGSKPKIKDGHKYAKPGPQAHPNTDTAPPTGKVRCWQINTTQKSGASKDTHIGFILNTIHTVHMSSFVQ